MESNTLMTPASFVFLRAFLTGPDDSQIRTIMGMRHIDPRILKTIGVQFVIIDLPISGATLRAQIAIPVSHKARELLGFSYPSSTGSISISTRSTALIWPVQPHRDQTGSGMPTKLWDTSPTARQRSTAQSWSTSRCRAVDRSQIGSIHDRPRSIPRSRDQHGKVNPVLAGRVQPRDPTAPICPDMIPCGRGAAAAHASSARSIRPCFFPCGPQHIR